MRRFFILLPTLLILGNPGRADDPPPTGVKACNKALHLMDEGKPAEALAVLEAAKGTMAKADEWLWWGNKGHAHWDLRQDEQALAAFRKSVELKADGWFRVPCANLLVEFGRYDEALAMLDGPIDKDYEERAQRLRAVIEGPYRKRWPHAYRKLEYRGKDGHYQVVSDLGVSVSEMDDAETEVAKLNTSDPEQASRIAALLEPAPRLQNLCRLLEQTRSEYLRLSGVTEVQWPPGQIRRVYLLKSKQEFLDFAKTTSGSEERENVLGFFDPNFKEILLFNQPGGDEVCGIRSDTLDTFWHEGWHQFFDVLTTQRPAWINEGIAEFVGKGEVSEDGTRLKLGKLVKAGGEHVTRFERIQQVIAEHKEVPFREFFRLDTERWSEGDVVAHYAQAWSIVYYALKSEDAEFRDDFMKLFRELVKGTPWADAVTAIFSDAKLDAYERAWRVYVENLE